MSAARLKRIEERLSTLEATLAQMLVLQAADHHVIDGAGNALQCLMAMLGTIAESVTSIVECVRELDGRTTVLAAGQAEAVASRQ